MLKVPMKPLAELTHVCRCSFTAPLGRFIDGPSSGVRLRLLCPQCGQARHVWRGNLWRKHRVAIIKANLIKMLGGKCAKCGATEKLEFDHIRHRDWRVESMNQHDRMIRYLYEHLNERNIQLLCSDCNKRKGKPSEHAEPATA